MTDVGAVASNADPCVYYLGKGENLTIIAVYVDNILVSSKSQHAIDQVEKKLTQHFKVKDLGEINYCLGIEFTRQEDAVALVQKGYIYKVLKRFGMEQCNAVSTPMDTNVKLTSEPTEEEQKLPYRELVGCLTYLALTTRPDISFAASRLGQFNDCFSEVHWKAAKRVLRYLKGTTDLGLVYRADLSPLMGFVDSDWGGCEVDRRSQSDFVFMLGGCPVSWESRKQRKVALSSTEAEYMALTESAKEAIYLKKFLEELGLREVAKATMFCDNLGAIKLAENPVFHGRSKHIDIRHHFVWDVMKNGTFSLKHMSTEEMVADFLTKGLPKAKHVKCLEMSGMLRITGTKDKP